ncbi:MAG: peptidoglycan editing factor PgeF [Candidatus Puniceispirillaceae bacterium]
MTSKAPFSILPLKAPSHIDYGFFGRRGGVSTGLYDSLNCGMGSSDDKGLVMENRAIAASSLDLSCDKIASVFQIHSAEVVTITSADQINHRPRADGLVTNIPDIGLSILTADCAPILLMDKSSSVIGACHAGWRGAALGIIQNTVKAMVSIGAHLPSITAIIGPTIAHASYQVGADMRAECLSHAPQAKRFFTKDDQNASPDSALSDKYLFDLPAFAGAILADMGVGNYYDMAHDTYSESEAYFSHRRATHKGKSDTGRQIALISSRPFSKG